ncbi:MAG: IS110 family transposase [Methylococcales bacterium]|nr:IS110 family transposase [Methylococcales bacterium]
MSQNITRIGIDLAKNIFQVCATNKHGKVISNQMVKRRHLTSLLAKQPQCEVVMEACAGSNYWYRVFSQQGHQVKLIHPAYVRPYVKTNKNDAADAEAICEAASRPNMRFVHPKTPEQQDIQLLHRIAERLVSQRTALSNQSRGLLAEYGLIIPEGSAAVRREMPRLIEDAENELSLSARYAFQALYEELIHLDQCVDEVKAKIILASQKHAACQRLMSIPGVGPMVATAVFSVMGDASQFKNGREFAAFLGLVPRQYSSGGKTILKGISKRGDRRTRMLLIQGALAALNHAKCKQDSYHRWAMALKERKGTKVTVVALANKIARICWALSANKTTFNAVVLS